MHIGHAFLLLFRKFLENVVTKYYKAIFHAIFLLLIHSCTFIEPASWHNPLPVLRAEPWRSPRGCSFWKEPVSLSLCSHLMEGVPERPASSPAQNSPAPALATRGSPAPPPGSALPTLSLLQKRRKKGVVGPAADFTAASHAHWRPGAEEVQGGDNVCSVLRKPRWERRVSRAVCILYSL